MISLNPSVATVSRSFFWFDMHGSRRMKPADFGDPLTFPLTPQRGWHLWFSLYHKCQLSDGLPWHFPEIFQVCRGYSVTTLMIPSLYTVLWVRSRWLRKRWQKKPINYSFFFFFKCTESKSLSGKQRSIYSWTTMIFPSNLQCFSDMIGIKCFSETLKSTYTDRGKQ